MSKRNNGKTKGQRTPNSRGRQNRTKERSAETNATTKINQETSNDISWWNRSITYPEVTRLPFNRIACDTINRKSLAPNIQTVLDFGSGNNVSIAGGMKINYVPFVGATDSMGGGYGGANAPINRAFTSMYAAMYAKTTGAVQFQQADLAITVMAVDSILTNIAELRRALGISYLYSDTNYIYPKTVLEMLGYKPDDIIGHQDELRRKLNDCIANLNAMRIPKFITVFDRHYSLAHNIYWDHEGAKAQLYTFVSSGSYLYTEAGGTTDSESLTFERKSGNLILSQIETLERQLNAIRASSSFGLVMGSIARAFPATDILMIEPVGAENVILPVYDRNILWQIQNMLTTGVVDDASLTVYSDPGTGFIQCDPLVTTYRGKSITPVQFMLSSFDGDTSPEFVMESTRLMVTGYEEEGVYHISHTGTEIVESMNLFRIKSAENGPESENTTFITYSANNDMPGLLTRLEYLMAFKIMPTLYIEDDGKLYGPLNQYDEYTTIDATSIAALHSSALQSAYSTLVASVIDKTLK